MKKIFAVVLLIFGLQAFAQDKKPAFWQDIEAFKSIDRQHPPSKNAILLLGSSTFTKWQDVEEYFPGKTIINRGFGGSRLSDQNFYAEDLLNPYQPKQIIIYCGENDFADNKNLNADAVTERFKTFYRKIRAKFPSVEVDYISIKYSPSRQQLWPKMKEANRNIKKFMKKEKNAEFIDITKVMNDGNGRVRNDLFLEDMLHMKPEGYRLWTEVMNSYMK